MGTKFASWAAGGDDTLYHYCPACECLHVIPPKRWTRTGPAERTTYRPSFLQYTKRGNCHYFITDGALFFHNDCWHSMRGQHELPDIPYPLLERLADGTPHVTTDGVFKRSEPQEPKTGE